MRVLIVGSGGREHALAWKLAQSRQVSKIYVAPGNGGTTQQAENLAISFDDIDGLLKFALKSKIDLTVVGQEAALEMGIVDKFTAKGLRIFGPTQAAARIETSKAFSADFMERHSIPRPHSYTVSSPKNALAYVFAHDPKSYVIKADGLAAGKGVILPDSQDQAEKAVTDMMSGKLFGGAGKKIVFQERLIGQEASAFALSDGERVAMLPFFQDHKPIFDGDKGPNTGGMGACTPVQFITAELAKEIEISILQATLDAMKSDGTPYKGVLYAGLVLTDSGPKVIEFNARFGDPEAQAMMPMIADDWFEWLLAAAEGSFTGGEQLKLRTGAAATVALASGGYPGKYARGLPITGLEEAAQNSDVVVFHAGTKQADNNILTNGGRVLNVTAYGTDLKTALDKAYAAVKKIHFDGMHFRTDIGAKALSSS